MHTNYINSYDEIENAKMFSSLLRYFLIINDHVSMQIGEMQKRKTSMGQR